MPHAHPAQANKRHPPTDHGHGFGGAQLSSTQPPSLIGSVMKKSLAMLVLGIACSNLVMCDTTDPDTTGDPDTTTEHDLYITGSNGDMATYWVNGEPTQLTDGTHHADSFSIFLDGDDLYVAGFEFDDRPVEVAKYWKNGVENALGAGYAVDVAAYDGDVYVCGYETTEDFVLLAKYWVNDVEHVLTDGGQGCNAALLEILVDDGDIYVVGYTSVLINEIEYVNIATYWVNDVEHVLGDGTNTSIAYDMQIHNDDVYVCGSGSTGDMFDKTFIAKYWKNGVETVLTDGTHIAEATSIYVDDDENVHVCGFEENDNGYLIAKYWVNGVETALTDDATFGAVAEDIYVMDGDIHVVGTTYDDDMAPYCTYWINGMDQMIQYDKYTRGNSLLIEPTVP